MTQYEEQDERIRQVVGDEEESSFDDCVEKFCRHLQRALELPCVVTGIEDFRWEERFIFGIGNPDEHARLRKDWPSSRDRFDLLEITGVGDSEWMLFCDEDLEGRVRRLSDGREFYLGIAEIKAEEEGSRNHQLLHDYAVWFVNNR